MTIKGDSREAKIYRSGNGFTVVQTEYGKSLRKSMTPEVQVQDCRQAGTCFGDPYVIWLSTFTYLNDTTGTYVSLHEIELNDELTQDALQNPAMQAIHVKGNRFACRRTYANRILLDDIAAWFNGVFYVPGSESAGSSGGCYVATCVYGSYDCPQVWTLRRYRDDTLANSWYGRAFVRFYYAVSPRLVKRFGKTGWFQSLCKPSLDRLVAKLHREGVADTPYCDKKW